MVTDAKTTDLASVLLLASLHNRKLHVTSVTTRDDIMLIALSKDKGLKVTCDVSVYCLFLSQEDFPQCPFLPTKQDQRALWDHLSVIDIFSVGSLPYQIAMEVKADVTPAVGIADTLPLLLTAVYDGRLAVEDIIARLYENPKRIFELHDQDSTSVEVEVDRSYILQPSPIWSPFVGKTMGGSVQRVMFQEQTACLDGELLEDAPHGKDMSSHVIHPSSPEVKAVASPAMYPRPDSSHGRRQSLLASRPLNRLRQVDPVHSPTGPASAVVEDLGPPMYHSLPTTSTSSSLLELLSQSPFKNQNILSVKQFDRQGLHILFTVAQEMRLGVQRAGVLDILKGRLLCTLFYEPSTRTSASFDAAMQRLGGRTIPIATSHSSTQKGESLQDTIRTLACYGDAVVLRHPDIESARIAAKCSPVPIINGGNGSEEHPTQAFLDLFTIREELGTVTGLTITFVGDLLYGRTVHSLVKLLAYYAVSIQLVSPTPLAIPANIRASLISTGQLFAEATELSPEIVARSDVLYCTRVQKERFEDLNVCEEVKGSFVVDNKVLKGAKKGMIVMHPLPRNNEIDEEVDFDQRAAYFRQVSHEFIVYTGTYG